MANVYLKHEERTLVFILNPCHALTFFLSIVCLTSYNQLSELFAIAVYAFAFGGWLGLLISENDEHTPVVYIVVYYLQHLICSFVGPVILSLNGRYNMQSYMKFPLPWFGFILFAFYMRWVLMPISRLTWANLNHTLCGVHNDPFYTYFELGETYYLFGDIYLMFLCMLGYLVNIIVVSSVLRCFRTKEKI
jgi:hypothetical protein